MKTIQSLEQLKHACENVYLFMTDVMGDMEKMMETEKDLEIEVTDSDYKNQYAARLSWIKEWEHYDHNKEPKEVRDYQTIYVNKGDSVAEFMEKFLEVLKDIESKPQPQVNDLEPNIHML